MHKNLIPTLALVIPCYNEELVIEETIKQLSVVLDRLINLDKISDKSYILFIDDGSKDETWDILKYHSLSNKIVTAIKLSKNEGHQNALLAGMEHVSENCDCLISMDADLQQDINMIEKFIEKYMEDIDVVLGIRNDRKTDDSLKKVTALFFYKFMQVLGVKIIRNHADYRLLSNRANKAVLKFNEVNLFLRGIIPLVGFQTDYVFFDVKERHAGVSKYTFKKMISFAIEGITSFSTMPLRVISVVGFVVFVMSFVMGMYVMGIAVFTEKAVPGWASTVLPIYILGGIQILSVGIVGEYLGKIYKETKQRPRYFIEETLD